MTPATIVDSMLSLSAWYASDRPSLTGPDPEHLLLRKGSDALILGTIGGKDPSSPKSE